MHYPAHILILLLPLLFIFTAAKIILFQKQQKKHFPKIDKLQRIAEILEVDMSTLLNTTNVFNIVFNATANQSGYNINNQSNNVIDVEMIRKIIREELGEDVMVIELLYCDFSLSFPYKF